MALKPRTKINHRRTTTYKVVWFCKVTSLEPGMRPSESAKFESAVFYREEDAKNWLRNHLPGVVLTPRGPGQEKDRHCGTAVEHLAYFGRTADRETTGTATPYRVFGEREGLFR